MLRILRFPLLLLFAATFCLPKAFSTDGPFAGAVPVSADYAAGFSSITEEQSREILGTLVEGEMRRPRYGAGGLSESCGLGC
jgi:hypothetical protein